MKKIKASCWIYAGLAVILAAMTLWICLTQRDATPKILAAPDGARECIGKMLEQMNQGNFSAASEYVYGRPKLDAQKQRSTELSEQIWDAFTGSLQCTMVGDSYPTAMGVSQDVQITSLDVPATVDSLKDLAQELLETRVAEAESMMDVYDENHEYRQEFVDQVLRDAAFTAIENGTIRQQELTLNLIYDAGAWWIIPDQAFLDAISGGILK